MAQLGQLHGCNQNGRGKVIDVSEYVCVNHLWADIFALYF